MTKEVNTHITFNENCEYQSSTNNIIINVEPQPVDVTLSVVNKNTAHNTLDSLNNQKNYYDDILEVTAHVSQHATNSIIKTGRINFYYRNTNSNNKILLNTENNSCILTDNGIAVIQFKPSQSGTIIAEYVDDKEWYATTQATQEITLHPIPVVINFTKKPPYLTDLENSIELEVEVKKKYQNDDDIINYGVVTFLHYIEHFDMEQPNKRVESVIGNPVLVENGKAKINYIPVQEYNDLEPTQLIDGTEYIRAFYTYNNDLYFSEENASYGYETLQPNRPIGAWQYFESASVYTNIEIFKPNSVTIGIANKSINADGRYYYEENTPIEITATLFNDDGEQIFLTADDEKTLFFHVIGTYPTLKKNYLIGNESEEEYFTYNKYEHDFVFETYKNGVFSKTISNLKPGNYTIQASTHGQIVNGTVLLYDSDDTLEPKTVKIDGETHIKYDTDEVRNDTYLDSIDISNTIYIESTFKNIPYNITVTSDKNDFKKQENISSHISSEVTINNTYKEVLNNQKCFFFIPQTGQTYEGVLTYSNDKLNGRPIEDIKLNDGNFLFYMYIPGGYYTKNDTTIFLEYQTSEPIALSVRSNTTLNLEYDFISQTVLGGINYTVSSDDLYENESADATITLKKGVNTISSKSYTLTPNVNTWSDTFTNLQGGEYTLTASTLNFSTSKHFTIDPERISQQLQVDSKIINAHPNGVINLVISSVSADLNDLNLNRLHVYATHNADDFDINTAIEHSYTVNYVKEHSIHLVVNAGTYIPTKLLFAAYYEGDSNLSETLCEAEECNTVLRDLQIRQMSYTNNTSTFLMMPYTKGIIIIGKVRYNVNNNLIEERLFVTSDTLDIFLQDIPTNCNNIEFIIDPYNTDIIRYVTGQQTLPTNIECPALFFYSQRGNVYDALNYIKNQYTNSNNQCLFPLFNPMTIKMQRNIG